MRSKMWKQMMVEAPPPPTRGEKHRRMLLTSAWRQSRAMSLRAFSAFSFSNQELKVYQACD